MSPRRHRGRRSRRKNREKNTSDVVTIDLKSGYFFLPILPMLEVSLYKAVLYEGQSPSTEKLPGKAEDELERLYSKLLTICHSGGGSRPHINQVLFESVANILSDETYHVAVHQGLNVLPKDGLSINAHTRLRATFDYGLFRYKAYGSRETGQNLFRVAEQQLLVACLPFGGTFTPAIAQAVGWAQYSGRDEVRFCIIRNLDLTLALLKRDQDEKWCCYLERADVRICAYAWFFDLFLYGENPEYNIDDLRGLIQMLAEWFVPQKPQPFVILEPIELYRL